MNIAINKIFVNADIIFTADFACWLEFRGSSEINFFKFIDKDNLIHFDDFRYIESDLK
jgi:hypothetical protein